MRVSASHIRNKLELFGSVLLRMAVWTPGTTAQGIPGAVIAIPPSIDVLTIDTITHSSLRDSVFLIEANKG